MPSNEEREFRLRPRKPTVKGGQSELRTYATAFKVVMHQARMSRVQRLGAGRQVPANRKERHQRCAVRVTYCRNTVPGQWRAHGRYVERESATLDHADDTGFDGLRESCELTTLLDRWQREGDERIWKLIISPEFVERLDLKKLTRELLAQMARDVGSDLEWVAAVHYNTEHPHVHVALRGVDANGVPLRLDREYIQHGIRAAAEDLCTRQIGYRSERDAAESSAREVRENRFTSIDREISRQRRESSDEGMFQIEIAPDAVRSGNFRQQSQAARLVVLGQMGLARKTSPDSWLVQRDFEAVLRAMQRANDHQRTIAAHGVLLSDERLPITKLDLRTAKAVTGRVLVHGEEENGANIGRNYLLLEGTDARVHYVSYTPEIEDARAQGKLKTNSFARLRRLFIDGKPLLEVEDMGSADEILKNKRHLREAARMSLALGIEPAEDSWGGWLGRYQLALVETSRELQSRSKRSQTYTSHEDFGR